MPSSTRATSTRRLLEGWKHDVRNVWWIIDYNRQSLDSVVTDRLFGRIEGLFRDMGWNVVTLKYGRKLEAAFCARRRGGAARLDRRLPEQPLFRADLPGRGGLAAGGAGGSRALPGDPRLFDSLSDDELGALMTNLGGHDIETVLEAFRAADAAGDQPTCFICLHHQGHGPAVRRPQGQPFRPDERRPDGLLPRPDGDREGREWEPAQRAWTARRRRFSRSSTRCRSRKTHP